MEMVRCLATGNGGCKLRADCAICRVRGAAGVEGPQPSLMSFVLHEWSALADE